MKVGENIVFFSNFIKKKNNTNCYSLFFEVTFPEDNDTVYLALNYPYTVSRVNSFLRYLQKTQYSNFKME